MGTKPTTERRISINNNTDTSFYCEYAGTVAPRPSRQRPPVYKTELDQALFTYYRKLGPVKEIVKGYETKHGVLHVHVHVQALKDQVYARLQQKNYSTKTLELRTKKDEKVWDNYATKDTVCDNLDTILLRHYAYHNNMFQEKDNRHAFNIYDGPQIIKV